MDWQVLGWQDREGERYDSPPDPGDFERGEVDGVLYKAWDPNDRDSTEVYWVYGIDGIPEFDDLEDFIRDSLAEYGISFA